MAVTEQGLAERIETIKVEVGGALEAMRAEALAAIRLRVAIQDFDRGLVSLPELLELAKEPQE